MDESWRMRMGMPTTSSAAAKNNLPRRRSTEDICHRLSSENPLLKPEDFKDVFGGPPRTVISRQFSTGDDYFPRSSSTSNFYEEIFRPMENQGPVPVPVRSGRNLPEFRIPAEKGARKSDRFEGFYSDIFGWSEEDVKRSRTRSRSKSKTSSSSVLSSEDWSPLRPAMDGGDLGDRDVSLFASKLREFRCNSKGYGNLLEFLEGNIVTMKHRPINVPRRWNSTRQMHEEQHLRHRGMPLYSSNGPSYKVEYDYVDNLRGSNYGFCQRNPSPETMNLHQPNSYGSFKASADDFELNSPSSAVSSLCQDQETVACRTQNDHMLHEHGAEVEEDEVSSYVIEINGENSREGIDEAIGVDEAIAWAKEKFRTHCSAEITNADQFSDGKKDGNESTHALEVEDEEADHWPKAEEKQQLENNLEMELLDEKIRLWSTGKEADIRLLLSTLHHILWADSGWLAVPLTNLMESSQVKKACQKARLLLHPDKLQQGGATFLQKYVAEKAFRVLQDAWAAFISQDAF